MDTEALYLQTSKLYLDTAATFRTVLTQISALNEMLQAERKKNDDLRTEIELLTGDLEELRRTNEEGTIRRY